MTEPWTVAETWVLIGCIVAGISIPTALALWLQRRGQTETEKEWVDDWWWQYRHHFEDDEGESLEPGDVA